MALSAKQEKVTAEKIKEALEFDKQGLHREALLCLKAAADVGNAEAMTQLGKRLIIADRAPASPEEGVQFLLNASKNGGDEAPALLSVLHALGAFFDQSWPKSLELIVTSAQRGWLPAKGQLKVLCSDKSLSSKTREDDEYWALLASNIDFSYWQKPSQEITLNESPLVRSYPEFAPKDVCEWLINKSKGNLHRAQVYDSVDKVVTTHNTRTNSAATFNLIDTDLVNLLVQVKMVACVGLPFRHLEAAAVLHYDVGEQISDHYDFIAPDAPDYQQQISQSGQRVITFLLYLNDEYKGGETEFPKLEISHKGQQGEGMFFVNALEDGGPDIRTLHASRPILEGNKWIVSQFIRNRAVF